MIVDKRWFFRFFKGMYMLQKLNSEKVPLRCYYSPLKLTVNLILPTLSRFLIFCESNERKHVRMTQGDTPTTSDLCNSFAMHIEYIANRYILPEIF